MTKASIATTKYRVQLDNGRHLFGADEPVEKDGQDTAPAPDELLEASLASCTAITLRMYADRKQWNLDGVEVEVTLERVEGKTVFTRNITFKGNLDDEQKERLLQIAKLCPVSKTLSGSIEINTSINQ
ncbi:OsmC family protein [Sediminibacterium sp.]|uniref:OsmC family protein n=1 Tax=Sediminibacterium sp. TaxID=1917865 RepID=UPI0025F65B23|nr:OsmC family protein [Sediminibacterium sp.]MBW0176627.1 OsmC family protein [Sediminibacterium sp.]